MTKAAEFQLNIIGKSCKGIVDCSHNGVCSHCGSCCSDIIPLTRSEIDTLRHFVEEKNYRPHTKALAVLAVKPYDATCPFLNDEGECDVYDIRPEVCRLFSCWEKNPSTEKFKKLPRKVQQRYLRFYSKHPEVQSIRQMVFGQEVPF